MRRYIKILSKLITRSQLAVRIVCFILYSYLRFVIATSRVQYLGENYLAQMAENHDKSTIIAFWHNRVMLAPFVNRGYGASDIYVLVTPHRDGKYSENTWGRLGFKSIIGSKSSGAAKALMQMVRLLKKNKAVVITPDGPKGPRMQATNGSVHMSRMSGAYIVPMACSISRVKILATWDKMLFPLPFSTIYYKMAPPFKYDDFEGAHDDDKIERVRAHLQKQLTAITNDVDKMAKIEKIHPAPLKKNDDI